MNRENEIWDVKGHAKYLEDCWGSPEQEKGRHWEHMKSVALLVRGKTVLDVACGMGHLYYFFKDNVNVDYLGCDNSIEMLKKAQKFFPKQKKQFVIGDVYDLQKFDEADTVIAVSLLMHLPDIESAIREMWTKAKEELIFTIRLDNKGFFTKRDYSGATTLPKNKKLYLRGEKPEVLYGIIGKLDDLFSVEHYFYDERSSIFRLTRKIPKYHRGWKFE